MTTDPRTRAAVEGLWAHTVADPHEGLTALMEAHARRRTHLRMTATLAAAMVVLAALAAGWIGRGMLTGDRVAPAVKPPVPVTTPPLPVNGTSLCEAGNVVCLGHRTYRFAMVAPVRWHIPEPLEVSNGGPTTDNVETHWTHHGNVAGVSVLEDVRAAATRPVPAAAAGVPATASGFIHWLAARPFLVASTPRPATLGGHAGWHVRVRLRGGQALGPATCVNRFLCYPVTTDGPSTSGIWADMVADYTAVDLPGHGTAVVWSWAFGHDTAALARNRAAVDGISWPAH